MKSKWSKIFYVAIFLFFFSCSFVPQAEENISNDSDVKAAVSGVIFYQDVNYSGPGSQILAPGEYTLSQLIAKTCYNDWASSVLIPDGWTVVMYENDNFTGTSWTLTADTPNFVAIGANDKMSSCKIYSGPVGSTSWTVEAESYTYMSGVQTESCSEGGLNVGWIDNGDWMAYASRTYQAGTYRIEYRVASPNSTGVLRAELNGGSTVLGTVSIPNTGGWQNWTTISQTVTIPAGTHTFGINAQTGGWNINWIKFTYLGASSSSSSSSSSSTGGSVSLIPLNSGMSMTIQFQNNSSGRVANSQIYVTVLGRNASGQWCYLQPNGTPVVIPANQTSDSWFYRLSDITGFQVPANFTSVRVYMSKDQKLSMRSVVDAAGYVGIVQPDLNNPSDPNQNIVFDWWEFTVSGTSFWGNTTQVDQYGFSYTMAVYDRNLALVNEVGITTPRDQVFTQYNNTVPAEFKTLVRSPYRILAPCKGDFRVGRTYGNYFASYVDQVWNQYKTQTLVVNHPLGTFNGKVLADDRFEFTRTSDGAKFYIARKPNNDEIFEGSGVLATGNTVELALQAWVCAALNRKVMHYANTSYWNNASYYYLSAPANYYSKFFHDISLGKLAYGFCYDDVNDQSTLVYTPNVRGIVVKIYW